MSDCRDFHDLLQDELDGRLAAGDAERLALHLASCGRCALERQALASLRATFRAMPKAAAPAGFRDDVMSALPKGRVAKFPVAAWLGAAAAMAASVVLVVALRDRGAGVEKDTAAATVAMERNAVEEPGVPHGEADAPKRSARAHVRDEAKPEETLADAAAPAPASPPTVAQPSKTERPADAPTAADGKSEKKKVEETRTRSESPRVRYVVFHDAAAADRFARSLSAPPPKAAEVVKDAKEKAADDAGATAQERGFAEREDASKAPRQLLEEASQSERRVVARTAMTAPPTDADLAARAAADGGTVVPDADAAAFQALLDAPPPPAPPAAAAGGGAAAKPDADKAGVEKLRGARKQAEGLVAAADEESGPFVVVVVVLEPAAASAPTSPR